MSVNILAVKGDGIIISPLVFNGITLDLGLGKNKDMSYNIYTIVDSRRIGWKNVQIELVALTNNQQAYYVRTFQFAKSPEKSITRRMILLAVQLEKGRRHYCFIYFQNALRWPAHKRFVSWMLF